MRIKKKSLLVVAILMLLWWSFYFAQPWIAYYTSSHWDFSLLCQSIENGSYWNESLQRGLTIDAAEADDLKKETIFLNKKIQKLDHGLYLLQCDGISEWGTWLVLFNRYPISYEKSKSLVNTMKIKGCDNNVNITQNGSSVPTQKLFGKIIYVILPSPTQIDDTIILEIGDREIEIEIEKMPSIS